MNEISIRYQRQKVLAEIGDAGQEKLSNARVLIVGAGGLGCPALQNLAGAGVGQLGIVDGDHVEVTNLHRQYLYTIDDCGKNKAIVASQVVSRHNSEITVTPYPVAFSQANAAKIISGYQIVLDCSDNAQTRYLINDIAVAIGIPIVYASIHKFEGQIGVFNCDGGPTLRCIFPQRDDLIANENCNDGGVLGVLPNIIGALQATEAIKIILGKGQICNRGIMLYDGLYNLFETIGFERIKKQYNLSIQNGSNLLDGKILKMVTEIDAVEFFNFTAQIGTLVIDIRENYEEPKIVVEKMINIPLIQLEKFLESKEKDQPIMLCCQRGYNSLLAANYFLKKGFTRISHLENGIDSLADKYKIATHD